MTGSFWLGLLNEHIIVTGNKPYLKINRNSRKQWNEGVVSSGQSESPWEESSLSRKVRLNNIPCIYKQCMPTLKEVLLKKITSFWQPANTGQ